MDAQAPRLWSARLADAPVSCMCCGADWGMKGAGLVGRPGVLLGFIDLEHRPPSGCSLAVLTEHASVPLANHMGPAHGDEKTARAAEFKEFTFEIQF